jgi:hypothetical protein
VSWTPKQAAALTEEQARKQHMKDAGVAPENPAEREAWEAEHITEAGCSYCRRDITLDTSVPDSTWVDVWYDADCPDSPDGLHAADEERQTVMPGTISRAEIGRILDEWYAGYGGFSRIDDDVFLSLRNRLIPIAPGEPVQFLPALRHGDVDPAKRRWLNGTFGGPVDNPDDPYRSGDVWVTATASGRRVAVFLSSVRRHA